MQFTKEPNVSVRVRVEAHVRTEHVIHRLKMRVQYGFTIFTLSETFLLFDLYALQALQCASLVNCQAHHFGRVTYELNCGSIGRPFLG
jgi:hypothetical protein